MDLKTFITETTTLKAFAAVLEVPPPLLSQWANGRRQVPAERCLVIERLSNGAVTCEELRADVEWSTLRKVAPKSQRVEKAVRPQ